ncbi:hypothetical protein F5B17DRAFT_391558 [Nemania serpens]|nr:hypothetical protein F5B17DRAFT_391558 [Nemania serpens]
MKFSLAYPALLIFAAVVRSAPPDESLNQPRTVGTPRAGDARAAGISGGKCTTSSSSTPTLENCGSSSDNNNNNNTVTEGGIKKGGKGGGKGKGKGQGAGSSDAARLSSFRVTFVFSMGCVVASLM